MPTIYISDSGNDKNDGLSLKTAIYSLKQAKKLQGGKAIIAGTSGHAHGSGSKGSSQTRRKRSDHTHLTRAAVSLAITTRFGVPDDFAKTCAPQASKPPAPDA